MYSFLQIHFVKCFHLNPYTIIWNVIAWAIILYLHVHYRCSMLTGFQRESWVWDQITKSPEVLLSSDRHSAYFYIDPIYESTGTAGKDHI